MEVKKLMLKIKLINKYSKELFCYLILIDQIIAFFLANLVIIFYKKKKQ